MDARIVELIPSSSGGIVGNELPTGREWTLRDTLIDNKETSGIFFGPSQRVYYAPTTSEPLLDDKLYRLELSLPDGKQAGATTTMVESSVGAINQPPPNLPNYKMGFAAVNPDGTATYPNFPFKWTTSPGPASTASLVVHFEERYYADDALTLLDSARDRSVTLSVGSREVNGLSGFQTIDEPFECQRLYGELSTAEANPRIRRVLGQYDAEFQMERAFDFVLQVANQDLAIYLDVNETTNSIVQDRPTWTNIEVIGNDGQPMGRRWPVGLQKYVGGIRFGIHQANHPAFAGGRLDCAPQFLLACAERHQRLQLRITRCCRGFAVKCPSGCEHFRIA